MANFGLVTSLPRNGATRDAEAAFVSGRAFHELASGIINRIPNIDTTDYGKPAVPREFGDVAVCATNLGLAVELYLKALLVHLSLGVPSTHDLRILYDPLPLAMKETLEWTYLSGLQRAMKGSASAWSGAFTIAWGPPEEPEWNDRPRSLRLDEVLTRSKDIFVAWRYAYEFEPADDRYQFRTFEYLPLWCAAEALRVELVVRLSAEVDSDT